MNSLIATVSEIRNCDSLHIVKFESNSHILSMMSLELNDDIKTGVKVKLSVSPSHVAIAKDFSGDVSYSNRLPVSIISMNNGKLLSTLKLGFFDTVLESIITAESSKRLDLKVGDHVTALIKASELSISKVIYD